jgi:class 3 adenylate cyclase
VGGPRGPVLEPPDGTNSSMTPDSASAKGRLGTALPVPGCRPWVLVADAGGPAAQRFEFFDRLEIGRDDGILEPGPAQLLIADPTISRRHCLLRRTPEGRCFLQDISRNGTRVDGRRVVPNVEVEVRSGQVIALGSAAKFVVEGAAEPHAHRPDTPVGVTVGAPGTCIATVLVGDIRDYTGLVLRGPSVELQQSVSRLFEQLSAAVGELGGTVKEYQGDAILAFWEGDLSGAQAVAACRAALALDQRARELARDPAVWRLRDFPLHLDWALATGPVMLDSFGGDHPTGLSLIGEPVVLAFRLEKFATDQTGRIVVCRATQAMAAGEFRFRNLGKMTAKGFSQPDEVFALDGEAESTRPPTSRQ